VRATFVATDFVDLHDVGMSQVGVHSSWWPYLESISAEPS
jgi:hypothetical protein